MITTGMVSTTAKKNKENRWKTYVLNALKINLDASVFRVAQTFSVGMVARGHAGSFLAGKTMCFLAVESVVEVELI